jgi:hypothetical protein
MSISPGDQCLLSDPGEAGGQRRADEGRRRQLVTTNVELLRLNDQVTAFRFNLDGEGNLVPGSVNSLFKELRVASQ